MDGRVSRSQSPGSGARNVPAASGSVAQRVKQGQGRDQGGSRACRRAAAVSVAQRRRVNYPLLADLNKVTARDYGILMEDEGVALRGLFLISPEGVIMHSTINSLSVGRSVTEAMRVMKAFQFVSSHVGQVCPADWEEGKDAMTANSDGMKKYLTNH